MAVAVGDQRRKKEAMEHLVSELLKGDEDSILISLRTAIERGWLNSFPDCLLETKKKKDGEIDRICSRHYLDFLNSVNEMLKMQGSARNLSDSVKEIHGKFQDTSGDLFKILQSVEKIQTEREQTHSLVQSSLLCKEIASLMVQVRENIEQDQYYQALITIEWIKSQLNNIYISPLLPTLTSWLPITTNKLLYGIRTEVDAYLLQMRTQSQLIGNTIFLRQAKSIIGGEVIMSSDSGMSSNNNNNNNNPNNLQLKWNSMNGGGGSSNTNLFYTSNYVNKYTLTTKYLLNSLATTLKYTSPSSSTSSSLATSSSSSGYFNSSYGGSSLGPGSPNTSSMSSSIAYSIHNISYPVKLEEILSYHYQTCNIIPPEGNEFVDHHLGDLASLHRILYLYARLGNIASYYEYYDEQRREYLTNKIWKCLERDLNAGTIHNSNATIGSTSSFASSSASSSFSSGSSNMKTSSGSANTTMDGNNNSSSAAGVGSGSGGPTTVLNPSGMSLMMRTICKYFEELVGFFLLEMIIIRSIDTELPVDEMDVAATHHSSVQLTANTCFHMDILTKLWVESFAHFVTICCNVFITLQSPMQLLQIKEELLLLLTILLDDLFVTNWTIIQQVIQMIIGTFWEMYDALLVQSFASRLDELLHAQCSYQSYMVTSYELFQSQIKYYGLDVLEINQEEQMYYQSKVGPNTSNMNTGGGGNEMMNYEYENSSNGGGGNRRSSGGNATRRYSIGNTAGATGNTLSTPSSGSNPLGNRRRLSSAGGTLDANLDALEEEIGLSSSRVSSPNQNANNNGTSGGGTGGGGGNMRRSLGGNSFHMDSSSSSSSYVPQTFPFSEFVPLIMKEIHGLIVRMLAYVALPLPDIYGNSSSSTVIGGGINKNVFAKGGGLSTQTSVNTALNASGGGNGNGGGGSSSIPTPTVPSTLTTYVYFTTLIHKLKPWENIFTTMITVYEEISKAILQELRKDGMETSLSKVCQLYIDSAMLTLASDSLWTMLLTSLYTLYGQEHIELHRVQQTYDTMLSFLRACISQSQDLLFELLSDKINMLLESALLFITYDPDSLPLMIGGGGQHQRIVLSAANPQYVHESIDGIIEFLSITFMCFTHLPKTVREAVYFTSCSKLSQGMLAHLLSNKVMKLNIFSLIQFDADCKKLISFADSCGIPDLRACFEELNQLIQACLVPDLMQLCDNIHYRNQLFPRVSPAKLATILEKVAPSPMIAASNNLPKFDKSTMKNVIKKLRLQAQKQ